MKADDLRRNVANAYTRALERSKKSSKESACCEAKTAAGSASEFAGYASEIETFPDAAGMSFGCGNPLAFSEIRKGDTVLDLGSGAGFDLLIAAEKTGPEGHVIGIDMTDAMIETARKNAAKAGFSNIEIRKGLIEDLPVEDDSVDWVISNCVVNLSADKNAVFAEIARVLSPGGRFSISDIVVEDLPESLRHHEAAYAACVAGAISEAEYVAGLERAGLAKIRVSERLIYDEEQLRGIVASDLMSAELDPTALDAEIKALCGLVASIRISGFRPEQ